MQKLSHELHVILLKRIAKAIDEARYYPASAANPGAVAAEVLRPYAPRPDFVVTAEWPRAGTLVDLHVNAASVAGAMQAASEQLAKQHPHGWQLVDVRRYPQRQVLDAR